MRFQARLDRQTDVIVLMIGTVAALLLGIWQNWFSALSLMIGVLTTIVYLKLIARQVKRLRKSDANQAKQAAVKGVFLRYLLVMVVLVTGTRIPWINLYWLMGGLLLIPLSSFISLYTIKGLA